VSDWVTFPGGELEGERPNAMCTRCRERAFSANRVDSTSVFPSSLPALPDRPAPLCFQCYRLELERQRRARAASELQAMSEERLQFLLPLEAVDQPRLTMLRAELAQGREVREVREITKSPGQAAANVNRANTAVNAPNAVTVNAANVNNDSPRRDLVVKRRRAQIAARHALSTIAGGLAIRRATGTERLAIHPFGETGDSVQFPASWIPFLVSRQRHG
jgi:hypothetical protein